MGTRQRRLSAAQARRDIVRQQYSFAGGMVTDRHPSSLGAGQVVDLLNIVPNGDRLKAVSIPASIGTMPSLSPTHTIISAGVARTDDVQSGGSPAAFFFELTRIASSITRIRFHDMVTNASIGTVDIESWVGTTNLKAVPYRDGVLVKGASGILLYIGVYGTYAAGTTTYAVAAPVRMNDPIPNSPIIGNVANTGFYRMLVTAPGGSQVYYFRYTFVVRNAQTNQLIWESMPLTLQSGASDTPIQVDTTSGSTTLFSSLRISHTFEFAGLDNVQRNAAGTDVYSTVTHIRVWRTLNVGIDPATGVATGNRRDEFFLVYEGARSSASVSFDLGTGGATSTTLDDVDIIYQPRLEVNLSPITAVGGELEWSNGVLVSSLGNRLQYSETETSPEHAGYWYTGGPQERVHAGKITGIAGGDGYFLIATVGKIIRMSTQAANEVANGAYPWMSRSAFWSETLVIEGEGVASSDLMDQIPGGIAMLTTADQLRIYNGQVLGDALDRNRIHDGLRSAACTWLRYSPEGFILVGNSTYAYRMDLSDNYPWSRFVPTLPFENIPFRLFFADRPTALQDVTGLMWYEDAGETYLNTQILGEGSSATDMVWSVTLPQYKGEWDGYLVVHRESLLTAGGTWTDATATLTVDSESLTDYGQRPAIEESISIDGVEEASISLRRTIQQTRWVQLRIDGTTTSGAIIHRVQTACEVQDRPWRAQRVLGEAYDRTVDLWGQRRAGWDGVSLIRSELVGTPSYEWGNFDDAALANDGYRWNGIEFGTLCYAEMTQALPASGGCTIVSLWVRLSDLEALTEWAPLVDLGVAKVWVGPGTQLGEYGLLIASGGATQTVADATDTVDADEWVHLAVEVFGTTARLYYPGGYLGVTVSGSPDRAVVGKCANDAGATPTVFDVRLLHDATASAIDPANYRTDWKSCLKRIDPALSIVEQ